METSEPRPPKSISDNVPVHEKQLAIMKLELLKKISFFKCLSPEVMQNIIAESKDIFLNDQEILFYEGSDNCNLYVILSGSILIAKGPNYTKHVTILSEGECLGEISLIDQRPRSASAIALGDTLVVEFNEEIFHKFIFPNTEALLEMMKVCSSRLRNDLERMSSEIQQVSNFTHDMRNCLVPLGTAEVFLDQALKILCGTEDNHQKRTGWDKVQKGYNTMLSVRNNMITMIDQSLATVKKVQSKYIKGDFDILGLINETVDEINCHKDLQGKPIYIKSGAKNSMVHINYLDIKRVLQNLILNSGYATAKGGAINIYIKDIHDLVEVSVEDQGTGIPEDVKTLLLKENYTSKPDGNGFGLMSCTEIIRELHNGKIGFESELGKGTTFYFTLPVVKSDSREPATTAAAS
ncbi:MAG: ATP-binding protein [Nitrospinota bacterium]|nr:ATP-binding protein [Nitrospinota bacterium]